MYFKKNKIILLLLLIINSLSSAPPIIIKFLSSFNEQGTNMLLLNEDRHFNTLTVEELVNNSNPEKHKFIK